MKESGGWELNMISFSLSKKDRESEEMEGTNWMDIRSDRQKGMSSFWQ